MDKRRRRHLFAITNKTVYQIQKSDRWFKVESLMSTMLGDAAFKTECSTHP
jgi:hypothetical protein